MTAVALVNHAAEEALTLSRTLETSSACHYQVIPGMTLDLQKSLIERRHDNGLVGPLLSASYRDHLHIHAALPKTKEEANERGIKPFDGLQVSLLHLEIEAGTVRGQMAPIRYSYVKEFQDLRSEALKSGAPNHLASVEAENPYVIGSAVYAVVPSGDGPRLVMQIKGHAQGEGEFHPAVAAGGISRKAFETMNDPVDLFRETAFQQAKEELGFENFRISDPSLIRVEDATGNIAIGYLMQGVELSQILESLQSRVRREIGSADDVAKGIGLLPVKGLVTVSLDSGKASLEDAHHYIVDERGISEVRQARGLRPAAQGMIAALQDETFTRKLLEVAGV